MSAILLDHSEYTARKKHYCDSCNGTIEAGQRYVRQRIVDGSEGYTYKAHDHCKALSDHVGRCNGCYNDEYPNVDDFDREDILACVEFDLAKLRLAVGDARIVETMESFFLERYSFGSSTPRPVSDREREEYAALLEVLLAAKVEGAHALPERLENA